jgi:chaperonin GroEL (HSP60 family)
MYLGVWGVCVVNGFERTQALEVIPKQLSENAGFDSTDILNLLRTKHFHDKVLPIHHVNSSHTWGTLRRAG